MKPGISLFCFGERGKYGHKFYKIYTFIEKILGYILIVKSFRKIPKTAGKQRFKWLVCAKKWQTVEGQFLFHPGLLKVLKLIFRTIFDL